MPNPNDFLQANADSHISFVLFFGTIGMLVLTIGLIVFIIFHQRKVIRYQSRFNDWNTNSKKCC